MKTKLTGILIAIYLILSFNSASAQPVLHKAYFDKSGMDTTVKPGENFFLYANGTWLKNAKIPASETNWGNFKVMRDTNNTRIHNILIEAAANDDSTGSLNQKIGDFFLSGMDTLTINKLGYDPIKPQLNEIAAVNNYKELVKLAASDFKNGGGYLFGFDVYPDPKNSRKYMPHFYQSELGLPDRDYYFKTDPASKLIQDAYIKYITRLFSLIGYDYMEASKSADRVFLLEKNIAQSHFSQVELRDPVKGYHKFSVDQFNREVPHINLTEAFGNMGLKADTILVDNPAYYKAIDSLLAAEPILTWKDKITFDLLNRSARSISHDLRSAYFDFYNKKLYGQQVANIRWQIMAENVDDKLGDLLGQLYVQKYFKPEAKERMLAMINNLKAVYIERLEKLSWMSPETKEQALAKINAFGVEVGYPDKWKNYDDVSINKFGYYQNLLAIAKHKYAENLKKLGSPVDRGEWIFTAPTIGAYNSTAFNKIVFPAGMLQFPFFEENADDAINYGAIGIVIGHEMTHGFDDEGSKFDKDGNLRNWWTKEDAGKFNEREKVVIDQYNNYTVLNGIHLNGTLSQGENLADIGGMIIAYKAFKNTPQGKSNIKIDGFTPDQRFFLSAAQVWRSKSTDEASRASLNDPHSPPMYRVNGPVSNIDAFYGAFNIKPGDKMYIPVGKRVNVW